MAVGRSIGVGVDSHLPPLLVNARQLTALMQAPRSPHLPHTLASLVLPQQHAPRVEQLLFR